MPATRISMTGMGPIKKWLDSFPVKVQKKFARKALRAGANVILPDARNRAPVSKEQTKHPDRKIKRDIKVRAARRTRKNVIYVFVLIGKGTKNESNATTHFYAGHVEMGHKAGKANPKRIIGRVDKRKLVPKRPFMEPAFKAKADAAMSAIRKSFADQLASTEVAAGLTGYS